MEQVLDTRQTLIVAILVLFVGKFLTKKVGLLRHFNIPDPVSGGLLASLTLTAMYFIADYSVSFTMTQRDSFLVIFFTCIGLSSRLSSLLAGGKTLLILLGLAVVMLFLQNFTGMAVTAVSHLEPEVGFLGGSVSLSGGHGTAIAWAPIFATEYGIHNAMELGIACATFGLVLGGIVGGPIARFLIDRFNLKSTSDDYLVVGVPQAGEKEPIDIDSVLNAILVISVAIGLGIHLNHWIAKLGLQLPMFVSCLFAGIVLTNTIPLVFKQVRWPTGTPILALISDLTLGLFLSMSLMSLQLWTLLDLAGMMVLLLVSQVVMISLFVIFVVFPLMGRTYDAAVISAGYAGLALGATPTAIANMTAVTERYGAAPQAFLVVPLVGAFFIDIANAFVINVMLKLFS